MYARESWVMTKQTHTAAKIQFLTQVEYSTRQDGTKNQDI